MKHLQNRKTIQVGTDRMEVFELLRYSADGTFCECEVRVNDSDYLQCRIINVSDLKAAGVI